MNFDELVESLESTEKRIGIKSLRTYKNDTDVICISYLKEINRIISGDVLGNIKLWNTETMVCEKKIQIDRAGCINKLSVVGVNEVVFCANSGIVGLLRIREWKVVNTWDIFDRIVDVVVGVRSEYANRFMGWAAGNQIGELKVVSFKEGVIFEAKCESGWVNTIYQLRKDWDLLAVGEGDEDFWIRIFDFRKQELLYSLEGHSDDIYAITSYVDLSSNKEVLISGGKDGNILFWDLEDRVVKKEVINEWVFSFTIIFDRYLVSTHSLGDINVFDIREIAMREEKVIGMSQKLGERIIIGSMKMEKSLKLRDSTSIGKKAFAVSGEDGNVILLELTGIELDLSMFYTQDEIERMDFLRERLMGIGEEEEEEESRKGIVIHIKTLFKEFDVLKVLLNM